MNDPIRVVAIHGAPRSGTTWTGEIFNSCPHVAYRFQPFFSYAFRDRINPDSSPEDLKTFFTELLATDDDFVLQKGTERLSRKISGFYKENTSHLVYKEVRFHHLLPIFFKLMPEFKAIGIIRDPCAVIASWVHAPREFDPSWSLAEQWQHAELKNNGLQENWYGFDRWRELADLFLDLEKLYPERFLLVRYESIVQDTTGTVDRLFAFADIAFTAQTRRFIIESTTHDDDDPYGVYRWHGAHTVDPLPESIHAAIHAELEGTELAKFLVDSV